MRKTFTAGAAVLLSAFLMGLCGCSAEKSSAAEQTPEMQETPEAADISEIPESRALLVCFSRAGENWEVGVIEKGNTMIAAEYIMEKTGADLFEIIPEVPYPSDYMETVNLAEKEQKENARPEIAQEPENWDSYDTVILGYPIWHGDLPMIVYTFLETRDFAGKTVYPFNTHGGSSLAGTPEKIRETIPDAEVKDGLALTGKTVQTDFSEVQPDIDDWLQKNGLIRE